ncbi:hypothetical protein JFL43_04335 [Viridibacillus sp. YIM B01967]|uniref:Aminoglycoside phosphotransferase domain-containing protein n=1 Tax=Viridibacillus soli TaxID=2798301 RepID=A0ABS1H3W5_9BACL|nr:hypothetical protein [Viridibacillus soli]MBK3494096.1 hypothetical protein [Viridibacillus soli]
MMRWVGGEHVNGELADSRVYNMGVLMGRLHEVATSFVPPTGFVRPIWGAESFKREMTKLERHYECFLSGKGWRTYQAAAEKVVSTKKV